MMKGEKSCILNSQRHVTCILILKYWCMILKYSLGAYICYRSCIQKEFVIDLYVELCMPYTKGEYKCQNTWEVCQHQKGGEC